MSRFHQQGSQATHEQAPCHLNIGWRGFGEGSRQVGYRIFFAGVELADRGSELWNVLGWASAIAQRRVKPGELGALGTVDEVCGAD